jgi:hypothetical protein
MFEKPAKGTFTAERRRKAKKHKAVESDIMREARLRDGDQCRRCGSRQDTEVAHLRHRGMGGNKSLDRTHLAGLITLCRVDHRKLDAKRLKITCGPAGTNGPVDWVEA